MRAFLELEGKLGLKPQSPSIQYRPSQPDTNPNARKHSKVTEKGMRIAPTKRFKAKIAVKPNSDEMTMQPPMTVLKPQLTGKIKHLHKKEFKKTDPHL